LFFLAPRLISQGDKPATHLPVNVILSETYLIETGSKGNLLISSEHKTHLPVNVILSETYLIETGSKGNLLISSEHLIEHLKGSSC
jgi:hypothetical protein